jgi:hypothetical protein
MGMNDTKVVGTREEGIDSTQLTNHIFFRTIN